MLSSDELTLEAKTDKAISNTAIIAAAATTVAAAAAAARSELH